MPWVSWTAVPYLTWSIWWPNILADRWQGSDCFRNCGTSSVKAPLQVIRFRFGGFNHIRSIFWNRCCAFVSELHCGFSSIFQRLNHFIDHMTSHDFTWLHMDRDLPGGRVGIPRGSLPRSAEPRRRRLFGCRARGDEERLPAIHAAASDCWGWTEALLGCEQFDVFDFCSTVLNFWELPWGLWGCVRSLGELAGGS